VQELPHARASAIGWMIYLGVAPMAVGFMTWAYALKRTTAGRMGSTTYLVPRLYDVDDGGVEIDGVDVRKLSLVSLGRVIGFVTQETYLFHASVRENLRFARPEATDEEVEAAARSARVHDLVASLQPKRLRVISVWNVRGGITTTVRACYPPV